MQISTSSKWPGWSSRVKTLDFTGVSQDQDITIEKIKNISCSFPLEQSHALIVPRDIKPVLFVAVLQPASQSVVTTNGRGWAAATGSFWRQVSQLSAVGSLAVSQFDRNSCKAEREL